MMAPDQPVKAKYVILGNSAGAVGAIEAIRALDHEGSIVAISDEAYAPYSRPLIADFLAGTRSLTQILYRASDFYVKKGVVPVLDAKVEKVDFEARRVFMADRTRFPEPILFEKLLLAVGGLPFVPPMEGSDKKNIFTFTSLKDAVTIKTRVGDINKILVIGGGLIGICVTEALVKLGKRVTIVELLDRVLSMNLDKASSEIYKKRLEGRGVTLITKDSVAKFVGRSSDDTKVGGAILKSGDRIDCDMVIVAIGVRPRLDLVKGTAVKVNKGIKVDRHMETSVPGVYACGDVAEAYDFVWDQDRLSPIWPNAYLGGRIAGNNMAQKVSEYPGSTGMTSFTYFDLPVVSAGMNMLPSEDVGRAGNVTDQECARYEVLMKSAKDNFYRKVIIKDGFIKGFIMINDVTGAGILTDLMRDRVEVSKFREALMSEELGIAHLPQEMLPARLRGEH
jgi:NAD(P)H-nitrite reductase large subunit